MRKRLWDFLTSVPDSLWLGRSSFSLLRSCQGFNQRGDVLLGSCSQLLIKFPARVYILLGLLHELAGSFRITVSQNGESRFIVHVLFERDRGRPGIKLQRLFALLRKARMVAEERP